MKEITDKQSTKRDELAKLLEEQAENLRGMFSAINNQIDELNGHIASYNDLVEEADDFRGEVSTEIEKAWEDKSEDWLESDEGEAQVAWQDEWQGRLDKLDDVETLVYADLSQADELLALPEEP